MFELNFNDCDITETPFWYYDQKWVEVIIHYNNQKLYYYFSIDTEESGKEGA